LNDAVVDGAAGTDAYANHFGRDRRVNGFLIRLRQRGRAAQGGKGSDDGYQYDLWSEQSSQCFPPSRALKVPPHLAITAGAAEYYGFKETPNAVPHPNSMPITANGTM